MIAALLVTIVIESVVDLFYCLCKKKPWISIVITGLWANFWTQAGLGMILKFSPASYPPILISAEMLIWLVEWLCFAVVPSNRLNIREAMWLSLLCNLTSFGIGLILPI